MNDDKDRMRVRIRIMTMIIVTIIRIIQTHIPGLISTELRKSGKRQNWKKWVVEVGEKKWSLEAKNGLPEFFVE